MRADEEASRFKIHNDTNPKTDTDRAGDVQQNHSTDTLSFADKEYLFCQRNK